MDNSEQILNALKAKLKEQNKVIDHYDYRLVINDCIRLVENIINRDNINDFEQLTRPVMKYLCENFHPHVTVVITPTRAELLEEKIATGQIIDYIPD